MPMSTREQIIAGFHDGRMYLGGTTCNYYTEVYAKYKSGRYWLMKKRGHSTYVDRFTKTRWCRQHFALFDMHKVTGGEWAYGGGAMIKWEGRMSKKRMALIEKAIEELP